MGSIKNGLKHTAIKPDAKHEKKKKGEKKWSREDVWYCAALKLEKQQTKAINKCIQDICRKGLHSIFLYKEFLAHYCECH